MKKQLVLLFSIFFLSSPSVFSSETLLYCVTENRTGFQGTEVFDFAEKKLILSFSDDFRVLELNDRKIDTVRTYNCKIEQSHPDELFCIEDSTVPYIFIYHLKNKKFTFFEGSIMGYPSGTQDTTVVSIGTCTEF